MFATKTKAQSALELSMACVRVVGEGSAPTWEVLVEEAVGRWRRLVRAACRCGFSFWLATCACACVSMSFCACVCTTFCASICACRRRWHARRNSPRAVHRANARTTRRRRGAPISHSASATISRRKFHPFHPFLLSFSTFIDTVNSAYIDAFHTYPRSKEITVASEFFD